MKKVLIVATVQSHIAQFHKPLINELKSKGYTVHVAARNNLDEKKGLSLSQPDKIFNVNFSRFPLKYNNLKAYKQLKKIISKNSYDIVHCNTPTGGVVGRLASRKYRKRGLKVIYTAHGFHFYKGASIMNWLLFFPIEFILSFITDTLITITENDYQLANKYFKCDVKHIHGVGVNSLKFDPNKRNINKEKKIKNMYSINPDDLVIMNVGELNYNKNQKLLISSLPYLLSNYHRNIKLLIAGNGPLEAKLKSYVEELNLVENVIFLGYTREIKTYLDISDFIVSCSIREGMPLNIIEAMSNSTIPIATKNRGHNELIRHNYNGFLLSSFKVEKIEKELLTILQKSESELVEIRNNARRNSLKYDEKNVIKELREIYASKD